VKGQLAGGGGILWRPLAQLVRIGVCAHFAIERAPKAAVILINATFNVPVLDCVSLQFLCINHTLSASDPKLAIDIVLNNPDLLQR